MPLAEWEQERTRLLEKICEDFKKVCNVMDDTHMEMLQHIEGICQMDIEVSQMKGKPLPCRT